MSTVVNLNSYLKKIVVDLVDGNRLLYLMQFHDLLFIVYVFCAA